MAGRVTSATWSKLLADVGETVELIVTVEDCSEKDELMLVVCEFSGRAGTEQVLQDLRVSVGKQSELRATWQVPVKMDGAVRQGIPEYQFLAKLQKKQRGYGSKVLKIGVVDPRPEWLPPMDEKGERPTPAGMAPVTFSGTEAIGLRVTAQQLTGFFADFVIQVLRPRRGEKRNQWDYVEVARISDVPIVGGRAETEWRLPKERKADLAGSVFRYEVELRHPKAAITIVSKGDELRSKLAKHLAEVRVYFALYDPNYDDRAFERAAQTWAASVSRPTGEDAPETRMLMLPFHSEKQFVAQWKKIEQEIANASKTSVVMEGHIFSHASHGDNKDGLEIPLAHDTIEKMEIAKLPKLRWDSSGQLVLHGCNTGREGPAFKNPLRVRDWCPASIFARAQGVRTLGQTGFAVFSGSPTQFVPTDQATPSMYLWAFDKGRNNPVGHGAALPPQEYR